MTNEPESSPQVPAVSSAPSAASAAPAAAAPPTTASPPPRADGDARPDRTERFDRRDRPDRDRDRPDRDRDRSRGRVGARRRGCEFCADKIDELDYKDVGTLRRYIDERGKIEARRKGGTCGKHQRKLAQAIKRARHVALLGYTAEHVRLSGVAAGRGGRR